MAQLGMATSLFVASIMIAPLCFLWVYEPEEPEDMKVRLRRIKHERK